MVHKKRQKPILIALGIFITLGFFISFVFKNEILAALTPVTESLGWFGIAADEDDGGTSAMKFTSSGDLGGTRDYSVDVERNTSCIDAACEIRGTAWLGSYERDDILDDENPIGSLQFMDLSTLGSGPGIDDCPSFFDCSNSLNSPYWDPHSGKVYGWARIYSIWEEGNNIDGSNDWGWVHLRGNIVNGEEYGVYYDYDEQKFSGWAWSGNGSAADGTTIDDTGMGWVKFDVVTTEGGTIKPYIDIEQGDVYSGKDIYGSDETSYATYLIVAAGSQIINFDSDQPGTEFIITGEEDIEFPEEDAGKYRSNMGDIDIEGLKAGKYATAEEITAYNLSAWSGQKSLENTVYYWEGAPGNNDFYINESMIFDEFGDAGNGTIIIEGNLYINNDITYTNYANGGYSLSNLDKLPSVAFIVKGDIIINSSVQKLVGVYVALDDPDTAPVEGSISTGTGSAGTLEVNGAMIAYKFFFEREGIVESDVKKPSEQILYDGRLLANPPPGLQNFAETLPQIGETSL